MGKIYWMYNDGYVGFHMHMPTSAFFLSVIAILFMIVISDRYFRGYYEVIDVKFKEFSDIGKMNVKIFFGIMVSLLLAIVLFLLAWLIWYSKFIFGPVLFNLMFITTIGSIAGLLLEPARLLIENVFIRR